MWEPGSKQDALDGRHRCHIGRLNLSKMRQSVLSLNLLWCLQPDPFPWDLML